MELKQLKKSKVYHLFTQEKFLCRKNNNYCSVLLKPTINYKFCKRCERILLRDYKKININNINYYIQEENIYSINDIMNCNGSIDNEDNITFNSLSYKINCISINKVKYYVIDMKNLYDIDNIDIFQGNIDNRIGKLLGPQLVIVKKNMIQIKKIKFNLWLYD